MKYLIQFWSFLTSFFKPVHPHKQAMLNVIKYIEENKSMWSQGDMPTIDKTQPTCFGGLLLRELNINSLHFYDLPGPLYRYLSDKSAFVWDNDLNRLKKIVNAYRP
jgi:hypothetical protein